MSRRPDPAVEAERAAIGAALHSEQAASVVLTRLSPDNLLSDTSRRVLGAMQALHADGKPADAVSVLAELNGRGGHVDLTDYVTDVPSAKRAEHHVNIVLREARRRKSIARLEGWLGQLRSGADPQVVDVQLARLGAEAESGTSDRAVGGGGFILDVPDEIPSVWGDGGDVAWAAGEPLMIVGQVGAGKTTIVQQVVLRRLGLRPPEFLGMDVEPIAEDGRVLYLACDRPAQIARSFRRMVNEDDRATLDERLVVWRGPLPFDLGSEPERLTFMARHYGATDVVIDSLKDVAMGLSDDEIGAKVNHALQALVADGRQVTALHHQRKGTVGNTKPNSLDDVYGSRWITAGAGSVLCLWGKPGDPIVELSHLKQPAGEVGPVRLLHDHVAGTTRLYDSVDVYDVVKASGKGITTPDVARHLFATMEPERNQIEKARRKLKALEDRGVIQRRPGETGGDGGTSPDRWHATSRRTETPI